MHRRFGQAVAVNFLERTASLNQAQRRLILVLWFKAGELEFGGNNPPCGRQKLIGTGCGTGVSLHHHPIGVAGKVSELASSIKSFVAEVFAVLPSAFGITDGVQKSPAFWGDSVMTTTEFSADALILCLQMGLDCFGLSQALVGALSLQGLSCDQDSSDDSGYRKQVHPAVSIENATENVGHPCLQGSGHTVRSRAHHDADPRGSDASGLGPVLTGVLACV